MNDNKARKLKVWLPLLFAIVLILGMSLGFSLRDTLRNKRNIQTIIERNDRLEEMISLINERYVDSINTNQLYKDAVEGILSHLDPHTVYIPAEQLETVNEDLEGSFFGIGVEFSMVRDTVQVTSVIENGPAEKAGVAPGDKFIKVNDSVIAGKNIPSEHIIRMLRGKQHTKVAITLLDALNKKTRSASVMRDAIPVYSLDAAIMLDGETGYIRINRFSATTYTEFMSALEKLQGRGMKQLLLDLRQNPGGYLEPAARIADQFLDGEKLVVYIEGRNSPREEYKTKEKGIFEQGRLVVLIDESSASASEILAGAVQDWDRGIIMGRRSFGKGLVQEQYELSDESALRLTIAKYFTPSGRSIQRSFAKGKEAYEKDFEKRFQSGELTGADSLTHQDTVKYYTARKRIVYGGGGIMPDISVPYDTSRLSTGLLSLAYSDELRNVVWDYYTVNSGSLRQYSSVTEFEKQFNASGTLIKSYLDALNTFDRAAAAKILSKPANRTYLETQAKAQLARILFRNDGYYAISLANDNMVQKALQLIHSDQYSALIGR